MNLNDNESSDYVLVDIYTGDKFVLDHRNSYTCGRKASNAIQTRSVLASRIHCVFNRTVNGLGVVDVGVCARFKKELRDIRFENLACGLKDPVHRRRFNNFWAILLLIIVVYGMPNVAGFFQIFIVSRSSEIGIRFLAAKSINGTYVNGVRLHPNVIFELSINDVIGIGSLPGSTFNSKNDSDEKPTAYRLELSIKDKQETTKGTNYCQWKLTPIVTDETEKVATNNKRKLSADSTDSVVPQSISRINDKIQFPDISTAQNEIKDTEEKLTEPRDPRLRKVELESTSHKIKHFIRSSIRKPGTAKSTKRVTFDYLTTKINFYTIKPGNNLKKCPPKDVPLMMMRQRRKRDNEDDKSRSKLEQFLSHIFGWNPTWLMEQRQFSEKSFVVDEKKLLPVLSKYQTYEDYYKVLEPLLKLELWHGITIDFNADEGNFQFAIVSSIVKNSMAATTMPPTTLHLTTLNLEVVVSKSEINSQSYPIYGDLVYFGYVANSCEKQSHCTIFAYVTSVRKTIITPFTHFNRNLINFVNEHYAVLTYTMMTKPLDDTIIKTDQVYRIKKISHLGPKIRTIEALQYLPFSPLMENILRPNVEDYRLPSVTNFQDYPLVTEDKLNAKQLETVVRITNAAVQQIPKICLIQGAPGTGKSRVIVNLMMEILYGDGRYHHEQPLRILVCSSSDSAIDEIVMRLLNVRRSIAERDKENRFKMVRIGDIKRIHPFVRRVELGELAKLAVKKTTESYLSNLTDDDVEEEKRILQARINCLEHELLCAQNTNSLYPNQAVMRKLDDVKAKYDLLMSRQSSQKLNPLELTNLQKATEESLLAGADVITCTLGSCYTKQMESVFAGSNEAISVCIIDEATQCTESETLVPLMLGVRTLILVGDKNQISMTMKSQTAQHFGLNQSLFARLQNSFEDQENNPIIELETQYRMSYPVALWPNRYFYDGRLRNSANLHSLPFHFYKVISLDSIQEIGKCSNTGEANFVTNLFYTMMTWANLENVKLPVIRVGIITTHDSQTRLITKKIDERIASLSENIRRRIVLDVNTIDGFQGQGRDIIIVSCASNDIEFSWNHQRLLVALTRAKHSLLLCGNFESFRQNTMWNALLSDARSRKVYVKMSANVTPDEISSHVVR